MIAKVEMVGLNKVMLSLDQMDSTISKVGIRTVSNISADARNVAYRSYFNKRVSEGGLRYNSPDRRKPRLAYDDSGYYDSRGPKHRLVHFGLSSRNMLESTAHLSSYPMNLWERPSKDHRPGLWIMTVGLPAIVNSKIAKHVAIGEAMLQKEVNKFKDMEK
jgi:hypothetical protein